MVTVGDRKEPFAGSPTTEVMGRRHVTVSDDVPELEKWAESPE